MKRLLLIVLPLLLIVGCSEVEGQQQLISDITERYSNGNIQSITYYKKTRDGIEKFKEEGYDYKGQNESEIHYKDGKLDGLFTIWYENGQKKSEKTYKDDKEDGLSTRWYENGQKRFEETWKDGELISYKYWNEDGSRKE